MAARRRPFAYSGCRLVIEAGVVAGYLIAWAVRKARRVGGRLDGEVDVALDAGLDKLHEVVADRLAGHPVLADLEQEAAGEIDELTTKELKLALAKAIKKDEAFAASLTTLVEQIRSQERSAGPGAITVTGGLHADHGSAAAVTMGDVTIGQSSPDPSRPGRSRD